MTRVLPTSSDGMLTTTEVKASNMWPTPTLAVRIAEAAEFNARLAATILEQERQIIGRTKPTTVAGINEGLSAYWLNYNVLNWNTPETRALRSLVVESLREWISLVGEPADDSMQVAGISCWANVLRYGECIDVHHHDPAFVSAHYTVQSGYEGDDRAAATPEGGHTIYFRPGFMDRSHGGAASIAASPWDDEWRISKAANPGSLFFFPSFIRHEVRPYLGKTQRISIAMDVFLKRQRLPMSFRGPRWFVPDPMAAGGDRDHQSI
jgi:hypothetical protein